MIPNHFSQTNQHQLMRQFPPSNSTNDPIPNENQEGSDLCIFHPYYCNMLNECTWVKYFVKS